MDRRQLFQQEEKKNVCFVLSDEEIQFEKKLLMEHSAYIRQLVEGLDKSKVR